MISVFTEKNMLVPLFSSLVFCSYNQVLCNHFAISRSKSLTMPHYILHNFKLEMAKEEYLSNETRILYDVMA